MFNVNVFCHVLVHPVGYKYTFKLRHYHQLTCHVVEAIYLRQYWLTYESLVVLLAECCVAI